MTNLGHNGGPILREGNWIAVSREMIEHHVVGAGNMVTPADKNRGSFSRLESWLDLLSMANFAERQISVAGATLILKPGQTVAGRAFLAKRWNWSEKTVRVWLAKLEAELMITLACEKLKQGQTKGHGPNILSICNWSKYQIEPVAEGPDLGRPQGHPRATQGPHYNKETNKQIIPPIARERADADEANRIARQAYEDGLRIKGNSAAKSGRSDIRARGELDGSRGLLLDETGRLQFVNGEGAKLVEELVSDFPGIDPQSVCNRAVRDVLKAGWPTVLTAMAELRRHAEFASVDSRKQSKQQGETPEARKKRLFAEAADEMRGRK